ncbi:MAG: four helix bundle protein [Gemmataceae bacterium]
MATSQRQRTYDLGERTYEFAPDVRSLVKKTPRTIGNVEDTKQIVRSSGSAGANYIEANEALGDKDFVCRLKIARKEAKESHYWLRLLDFERRPDLEPARATLMQEAQELVLIFSAMVRNRTEQS